MQVLLAVPLCVFAGVCIAIQPVVNAQLARHVGYVFWASLISITFSAMLVALLVTALRLPMPSLPMLRATPPWAWLGGVLGVIYVATMLWAVGWLGVSAVIVLALGGQLFGAAVIEHYGLFGAIERPVDFARVIGLTLVAVGIYFVVRKA